MSTTPVLIPVEEYLRTVYRPDCDYIDGEVLERNMGETPHARLQTFFGRYFARFEDAWSFETLTEQRLQVGEESYRVPDVMLAVIPNPDPRIVRTPPLLCIEILSSKDTLRETGKRTHDYAAMGVKNSWVIDPWRRKAYAADPDGKLHHVSERLTLAGTPIAITVAEIFVELDRLEKRAGAGVR